MFSLPDGSQWLALLAYEVGPRTISVKELLSDGSFFQCGSLTFEVE
jgi:hypothetical protein